MHVEHDLLFALMRAGGYPDRSITEQFGAQVLALLQHGRVGFDIKLDVAHDTGACRVRTQRQEPVCVHPALGGDNNAV